jgi:hypothetical protein
MKGGDKLTSTLSLVASRAQEGSSPHLGQGYLSGTWILESVPEYPSWLVVTPVQAGWEGGQACQEEPETRRTMGG